MYVHGIYDYPQGMGGLGSKLKKVVKKVERVTRPLVKTAAVVGTAIYAPGLLPMVAGAALKPKTTAQEVVPLPAMEPAPASPSVPLVAPAAIKTTVPFQAPTMPAPQMPPMQTFDPQEMVTSGGGPGMARSGGGWVDDGGNKKLLIYGAAGLGALGLMLLLSQRRR